MARSLDELEPLPRTFYRRETQELAQQLLGKLLVRRWRGQQLVGRITETEAYIGPDDLACHAARGRTARTEVMFGEAGHAYVYLIYGIHEMFNIVAEAPDFPAAILIRAVEPIAGVAAMQRARGMTRLENLTNGPGKFTSAFRITRALNAEDLTRSPRLFVASDGYRVRAQRDIATTPRIGIAYAAHCAAYPWRYYLRNSPFVSRR